MKVPGPGRRATRKSVFSRVVRRAKRTIKRHWALAWRMRGRCTTATLRREANRYLADNQERLLFVLGNGRSGTQLISRLLDASGGAMVYHEPNFDEDVETMDALRRDIHLADAYWREFRAVEVYRRWLARGTERFYGEVNGTLRYQTPAIKRLFPQAHMWLLTRDGRGVVRSIMGWPHFYGDDSRGAYALAPLPGDPYFAEWDRMSRFERVCWSWRDGNEVVMRSVPERDWIQLERLTSDYDYFHAHIVARTGLEVSRERWLEATSRRSQNASPSYAFPAWDDWTQEQRDSFARICGDTMTRLGYDL